MNSKFNKSRFPGKYDFSQRAIVFYLLLVALLYALTIFGIYAFNLF
ncbi:MAG: hypothetical protein AAF717_05365 [Bacteroidota bacterium]